MRLITATTALLTFVLGAACASSSQPKAAEFSRFRQQSPEADERKLVRSGDITVSVEDPAVSLSSVERIIKTSRGFVEWSKVAEGGTVSLTTRVPEPELYRVMNEIANLGDEEARSLHTTDVTDQYSDLATRLKNSTALRDRLQVLLDRAKTVKDVLAIEKELNRIQSEVETQQGQLDRLKSQIAMSELSIRLQKKQILGPLGYVGYGLLWAISKLFIIQ